jgi:hypothetical protein
MLVGLLVGRLTTNATTPLVAPSATSVVSTCSVGVTGTSAIITISGASASQECNDLVAGKGPRLCVGCTYYHYSGTPTEPEVCEIQSGGRHYVVRDQGVLKVYGNQICHNLKP